MSVKTKTISFRIPEPLHSDIEEFAARYDVPASMAIRWAMTALLDLEKTSGNLTLPLDFSKATQPHATKVAPWPHQKVASAGIAYNSAFSVPCTAAAAGSPIDPGHPTEADCIQDPGPGIFAARLYGDSMSPAYPDGSTVLLRHPDEYRRDIHMRKGEIYLLELEGCQTLKRYNTRPASPEEIREHPESFYISQIDGKTKLRVLESLNPAHPEIILHAEPRQLGHLDPDLQRLLK